ncbi:MAG: selenide, water dikinase SelD [Anaerolineales bacterium]
MDEKRALVVTTDFFTPVVDEAYDYGAIAAANSLSDVYAMGGVPFLALNIAALPPDLPAEISSQIFRGGAEKTKEAGVVIAGGHTIQDKEPKYGLIALGFVDKDKMLTKAGLKPGDALVLTKPLGFGCTTTALKQGKADAEDVREVVDWMKRLNRDASLLAVEFGISAATDITGFSFLGHAMEMATASGVSLHVNYAKIPFVSGAHKYAQMFTFPGGASDNRMHFGPHVQFASALSEAEQMLLFDPQTSGGLLLGVPQDKLSAFEKRASELKQAFWVVGEARAGKGIVVE